MIDLVQVLMNLGRWEDRRWYALFQFESKSALGLEVRSKLLLPNRLSMSKFIQVYVDLCGISFLSCVIGVSTPCHHQKKPTRRNRRTTFQKQH